MQVDWFTLINLHYLAMLLLIESTDKRIDLHNSPNYILLIYMSSSNKSSILTFKAIAIALIS